jgi:hypothetical protein
VKTAIVAIILATATSANAATWRCNTSCDRWSCSSQCGWVYSEQELYERGMARAGRVLDSYNRNGMRPSENACTAALESGMENSVRKSYGCRD